MGLHGWKYKGLFPNTAATTWLLLVNGIVLCMVQSFPFEVNTSIAPSSSFPIKIMPLFTELVPTPKTNAQSLLIIPEYIRP